MQVLIAGEYASEAEPDCYLIAGGDDVGDVDPVGYGPARTLRSAQVRQYADVLAAVSDEDFRTRFETWPTDEAETLAQQYREDDPDACEMLLDHFHDLRTFISDTASQGRGLAICMC